MDEIRVPRNLLRKILYNVKELCDGAEDRHEYNLVKIYQRTLDEIAELLKQ